MWYRILKTSGKALWIRFVSYYELSYYLVSGKIFSSSYIMRNFLASILIFINSFRKLIKLNSAFLSSGPEEFSMKNFTDLSAVWYWNRSFWVGLQMFLERYLNTTQHLTYFASCFRHIRERKMVTAFILFLFFGICIL